VADPPAELIAFSAVKSRHCEKDLPMQRSDLLDIDLEKQLNALAKEVGRLKKTATARGSALYDDAGDTLSDYYGGLSDFVVSNLPRLRKRARAFEATASNHPAVVAAVGLVVVGLVASLFWRGRPTLEPTPRRRRSK
jgi:hypothetical protein